MRNEHLHRRASLRLLVWRGATGKLLPNERRRPMPNRIQLHADVPQLRQRAGLQRADLNARAHGMPRPPRLMRRNADVRMLPVNGVSGRYWKLPNGDGARPHVRGAMTATPFDPSR
jgi:hypothetical protein